MACEQVTVDIKFSELKDVAKIFAEKEAQDKK